MAEKKTRISSLVFFLLALVGVISLPFMLGNPFRVSLAITIGIYTILALATNLLFGYTGLLALGQNAFFAIAPYAMAIAHYRFQVPTELAILLAILLCAVLALVVGFPVLRLRTHYFAMATLSFGVIVYAVALRWAEVTGGSAGLSMPSLTVLGVVLNPYLYYVTAASTLITFLICHFIINSKIGRVLQAIRDDEVATQTLGINTTYYKVAMFVLAAVFSAVAGILFATFNHQVAPNLSGIHMVLVMLIMVIVGGIASNIGAFIGAVFVVLLPQVLAGIDQYQLLAFGLIILTLLVFEPRGLVGLLQGAPRMLTSLSPRKDVARTEDQCSAEPPTSDPAVNTLGQDI